MQSIYWNKNCSPFWRGISGENQAKFRSGYSYVGSTVMATGHAYMYGSRIIRRARDDIFFYNGALPAGSVIYKWDMVYSYATAHAIPSLPLLINGRKYFFRVLAEADKPEGFYLRLIAYDREDQLVKLQIIRGQEGYFDFPKEANYYTVELVGAGCHQLVFHRIDVAEVVEGEDATKLDFEKLHAENERRRWLTAQVVDRYLRRREWLLWRKTIIFCQAIIGTCSRFAGFLKKSIN